MSGINPAGRYAIMGSGRKENGWFAFENDTLRDVRFRIENRSSIPRKISQRRENTCFQSQGRMGGSLAGSKCDGQNLNFPINCRLICRNGKRQLRYHS